jgi:hypothetical protein
MNKRMEVGRLALRREGEFWNAYWSPSPHNLDNAILIGCIRMNCVKGQIREDFMELMKNAFDTIAEGVTGETATWSKPRTAPENERGGNA